MCGNSHATLGVLTVESNSNEQHNELISNRHTKSHSNEDAME